MPPKLKAILFVFLFALLWLPLFQEFTKWFKEPTLKGAFVKPTIPKFSIDSINDFKFQKQLEDYENYNFGFRGLFVKIRNSVDYILFKELSILDNIAGKDGYIFSVGSIHRTLGLDYNGREKNAATIDKINFLKEGLANKGVHLIALIIPSKETIIPDFLPSFYSDSFKDKNDYTDFVEGYKKHNIPYIDYCNYFKQLKQTCPYPLFTKTGFHWSLYGASFAQDTLVNYVKKIISKEIPSYKRNDIELSDTAREPDNDFEGPLNLLFSLGQTKYMYPKLEMIPSTKKNYRPKVIIIGDSFFWQIKNQKMLMHIFSEDSKFWYYFATTSFPLGDVPGVPLKEIDVMKELESADFVLLAGNIGTLSAFPFGIADYYYDNIAKPEVIESIKEIIKNDSTQTTDINANASNLHISVDEIITKKAKQICRDKKTIQLKAANNKFICAGGDDTQTLVADRDSASGWETFSLMHLKDNKIILSSYKNLFLSVELADKTELTANRKSIGSWEIFTLQHIDNDFIALKAINGKYLSLDEKTQQLFANANTVGKNEKFKLINKK